MEKDLTVLLSEIDQIRTEMEQAVQTIDSSRVIYPGWTIKEMIGHITAWEIVIQKAIRAYLAGDPPYFLHEQDFDLFNEEAVDYRAAWSLDQVIQEWKDIRKDLKKTIQSLKETDLDMEIVLPWGSERTIAELIEIIGEHEGEHLNDTIKIAG
jgi:hypothetical protein